VKPLAAGRLRHAIVVKRATEASDGKGGYTTSWTTIVETRADVEGLDGRESVMEHVLEGVSVYRFRIRWRPGLEIRAGGQVTFAGRDLNVRAPAADPDGDRREMVFIADTSSARPTA